MDDVRSEIRAAFEREQAAHLPAAGLRRNVVEAVSARERPGANFQWVAVAAAVILGLLVVVGLMSTRFHPRTNVPAATPNASPRADYGRPPAGVSLIYVHDPTNPLWLVGYDWTGKPRGTVKISPAIGAGYIGQAPDGQIFQVTPSAKGGSGVFLDRLGQPILLLASGSGGYTGGVWADDNRHFCSISFDAQTYAWTLVTQLPGEGQKPVALIARDQSVGQTGISVAACSSNNDRAILVRTTIAYPSEIWVMQLSDGTVVSHHTYPANLLASITASRDAAYISENSAAILPSAQPGGAVVTRIRRVSDWTEVAEPGVASVLSFSGDDSRILLAGSTAAGQKSLLMVEDWRSGSTIWHSDDTKAYGPYLAEPGGRAFALTLMTPGSQDTQMDILIINGDGTTTALAGRYATAW
ncbi:MAG TPA: hypothetical protein VKF16_00570 [Candidatus Dormibacteraeota bacterium]|nr:hypothetical protein [Candidatus Dormibacteraeota bacterium]